MQFLLIKFDLFQTELETLLEACSTNANGFQSRLAGPQEPVIYYKEE